MPGRTNPDTYCNKEPGFNLSLFYWLLSMGVLRSFTTIYAL